MTTGRITAHVHWTTDWKVLWGAYVGAPLTAPFVRLGEHGCTSNRKRGTRLNDRKTVARGSASNVMGNIVAEATDLMAIDWGIGTWLSVLSLWSMLPRTPQSEQLTRTRDQVTRR